MRIVRFDHISYIEEKKEKEKVLKSFSDMAILKWTEENRENIEIKKNFLRYRQNYHDLYYFETSTLPIELIFYEKTAEQSELRVRGNTIYGSYFNEKSAEECFEFIGAKCIAKEEHFLKYNLRGFLDKTDVILHLEKGVEKKEIHLDNRGYSCPTLLVDSLDKIKKERKNGFTITKTEQMLIHKQMLEISFIACDSIDIIFELITPVRNYNENN